MPTRVCIDCGDKKELRASVRSLRCRACNSSRPRLNYRKKPVKARYRMINVDGKRIYTHRYIMETYLGRKLLPSEHIHHIDGDTSNNDISNLEILTHAEHAKIHMTERNNTNNQHLKANIARWRN